MQLMKSLSRRRSAALGSSAMIGLALASPAIAQQAADPRGQAGPEAPAQPLPDYAVPPQPLAPALDAAGNDGVAPVAPGVPSIAQVRVTADGDGSSAVPPAAWTPPAGTGIALTHQPGQPLDARWVEQQFASAAAGGALSPSRAVALVQLVNRAYATAGFINSGVLVTPSADPATLDLRLVFGRLADASGRPALAVEWSDGKARGLSSNYVHARFPSAAAQPLDALAVERDFRMLTEDPAIRSVSASLRPGEAPGLASLSLLVRPAPRADLYIRAANDRSPSVGGEQIAAGASLRNALFGGDTIAVDGGLTDGTESGQLAYSFPFLGVGTSVLLRGAFNRAAVTDRPLIPLDIKTREKSAEAGIFHTLYRTPLMPREAAGGWRASESLSLGLLGTWREQRSYLLGEPFSFSPGSVDGRTEYKAARLTADYMRRHVDHVVAASLTGTLGLGGTQSDIPSVPNPSDSFTALVGRVAFAKRLTGDGLEVRGRLTAQYAPGTLYSSERLSIGGMNSVRGYREALYLVDRGAVGSVELAYPFSLSGSRGKGGSDWASFIVSAFADGAWFRNAEDPQPGRDTITSVGATLSWTPGTWLRATVAYGHALNKVQLPQTRDLQDKGVHFAVTLFPLNLF
jgi:hemolysin activation/secretion protein